MAPRLSFLLIAACACGGELRIELPIDDGVQSAIVAFTYEGRPSEFHAYDVHETNLSLDYDGRARVVLTAQLYREKTCELMIEPGAIEPATKGFRLPEPASIGRIEIDGGDASEWMPLLDPVVPFDGLLLDPDPSICLRCGCVFADTGRCVCDDVMRRMPEAPHPIEDPMLPAINWAPPPIEPRACPRGSVRWYGETACTPVGSPCPAGIWPEVIPPGNAAYVDPAAPDGGDGSRGNPFRRIEEALGAEIVVLSKGLHDTGVALFSGQTVIGACTAETVISGGIANASLELAGDAKLSDVRIEGASVLVRDGSRAEIERVIIESSGAWALFADRDAAVEITDTLMRGVASGMEAKPGAQLFAHNLAFEDAGGGIFASGASVVLSRTVLWNAGAGVVLVEGTTATITETVIARNRDTAFAAGDGVSLTASRIAVLDSGGACAVTHTGARANIEDAVFSGCGDDGVLIFGSDAEVTIARARIERVARTAVLAEQPGSLALSDVSIARSGSGARFAFIAASVTRAELAELAGPAVTTSTAAKIELADLTIDGAGIDMTSSIVRAERMKIERAPGPAIAAVSSRIALADVSVRGAGVDRYFKKSVLFDFSNVTIDRLSMIDTDAGMIVNNFDEAPARIADLTISGPNGDALLLHLGTAEMVRARIEGARGFGILVEDKTTLDATDLVVRDLSNDGTRLASGIDSIGLTEVRRFLLDHIAGGYGARTLEAGDLTLESGEIANNRFGCGHRPGYDLRLLLRDVRFHDNDVDLSEL